MGVGTLRRTEEDCITPICNDCGIVLCYDISLEDYSDSKEFWDNWICKECNSGNALSLKKYKENKGL